MADCVCCARPMAEQAYACTRCAARARGHLLEIGELIADARDVAYGLSGSQGDIGASGVPGSRVPLNLTAGAKLDGVEHELGTLLRMVGEERGLALTDVSHWGDPVEGIVVRLRDQVEWLRHHPAADEHLVVIAACARVVRGVVAGPVELRYLGPCGSPIVDMANVAYGEEPNWLVHDHDPCDGDVYGRPGAEKGRCKACGAEVDQGERRAWLDDTVRGYTYHASEIADAYGLKANTIRQWASRGLLVAHGHHGDRPLYNLGEVLDLAAKDAARREEQRARRHREGAAA